MNWTDPAITPNSTTIKKVNIDELRSNYKSIEGAVVFSPAVNVGFTDPAVTGGSTGVKKAHIQEIRDAVNSLQTRFSNNCNCNNCCQTQCTCQGCQTCQTQCACQTCQTTCRCTCFPPGVEVLMADRTYKKIEDVEAGEYVIGVELEPIKVLCVHATTMGNTRSMWKFPDNSLKFTGEHPLWVRKNGVQWWGVMDIHHYKREELEPEFTDPETRTRMNYGVLPEEPLILVGGEEFAHVDGWKVQYPVLDKDAHYSDDYVVYMVVTEKSHTVIINGYLVSGFASDTDPAEYDHYKTDWKGLVKNHGG